MKSIVIPAYNEEDILERTYSELLAYLDPEDEVIFVDDGSHDRTREIIISLANKDSRVKLVGFSRNFGHQAAVTAGLQHAAGDAVVVMDCDLQDPPELLPMMIKQFHAGYDIVHCVRKKRKESLFKRTCYELFYSLYDRLIDFPVQMHSGDFSLMSRRVVNEINGMPEKIKFIRGLRSYVGFRQTAIEYERPERQGGEPKYTMKKLIGLALDGLFSFSTLPLRIMGFMGLAMLGLSLLCIFVLLGLKIFSSMAVGTTTTYVLVLFFGGANFLCFGILGEYVGKIFHETKRRPQYVIETRSNIKPPLCVSPSDSCDR